MFAVDEIARMSRAERMDAMSRLWESFSQDGIDYPSPAWHGEVLGERARIADSGDAKWLSLDELKSRLEER